MAVGGEGVLATRQLFLTSMSCIYLFAFSSLYTQIPGLYGPNGLAPVHNVAPLPPQEGESCATGLQSFKSLVTLYPCLGVSPSLMMELCCLVGVVLSLLMVAFRVLRNAYCFFALWGLYFSLFKVGQVFLWFQWDTLLLEAGLLTVLVAPFLPILPWTRPKAGPSDSMTLWLVRWLLFRLMFASGVVKLTSQCPTWWGLTALNYHFETQCIPTPLSWYFHQFPDWFQSLSVVATYLIEIATPFLFFLPIRSLRLLGFFSQVLLQVLIIVTGNYNFFNFLTIALCIPLLDDHFLGYGSKIRSSTSVYFSGFLKKLFCRGGRLVECATKDLAFVSVTGFLLALTIYYFQISFDLPNRAVLSNVGFDKEEFDYVLRLSVPACVVMAAISFIIECVGALAHVTKLMWRGNLPGSLRGLIEVITFGTVCSLLFAISIPSIGELDGHFRSSIPSKVRFLHDKVNDFSVTSSYGLFRQMTGVGGRPEIIIEGTNDNDIDKAVWKEYNFLYKPGNLSAPPVFVAPHQPRLDWQMWFAALGHYKNNPWLVHLVFRLLVGEKDVLQLIDKPPFSKPPKLIRARLYHYHFTGRDSNDSIFASGPWWQRDFRGDYLYVLSKDNPQLLEFLKSQNYLKKPDSRGGITLFARILAHLRAATNKVSPPVFIWSLFCSAMVVLLSTSRVCSERTRKPLVHGNVENYLAKLASVDGPQETTKKSNWRRGESRSAKGKAS